MKTPTQYDARLRAVSEALQQVEAPGDYCTTGGYTAYPLPGLIVDGVGDVAMPLTDATATAVIAASHLAPFGHGDQTLVDTSVRNTWELSTNQFTLTNPAFEAFVKDQIAEACRVPLGIHASVAFEAKLYKLLLYETGSKFARHQDSEKESGMFGTLVVVLPGRFEGGELVVHHPSAASKAEQAAMTEAETPMAHVFNAAAMDPFSLKYAAFYGDCPHELKPVTKGYRLCLTYNLVKVSTPNATALADPRFGSNHALYAALTSALSKFFCGDGVDKKKRQRIDADGTSVACGFDVTDPAAYRQTKLVYVLTHKYTQANLSFNNLKNRDAAVAASLARFCDTSEGALGLYLCKVTYRFSWSGEEGTMYQSDDASDDEDARDQGDKNVSDQDDESASEQDDEDASDQGESEKGDVRRSLDLHCPWIRYEESDEVAVPDSRELASFDKGDLTAEVAPCGVFHVKGFKFDGENSSEYTGNEGASSDRWYGTAALVVAPLQLGTAWALESMDSTAIVESWMELVDSKPAHARAMALAFGSCRFDWSTTSKLGVRMLETAEKMGDLEIIRVVLSAFERIQFQPLLRGIVGRFDWQDVVKMVETLEKRWHGYWDSGVSRNTINLMASILDGVTDTTTIAALFDAIEPVPSIQSTDPDEEEELALSDDEVTPEEFARVLQLASLVSSDRVNSLLRDSSAESLVLLIVPAIQLLFDTAKDQPVQGAVVVATANCALEALKQKIPSVRNCSYPSDIGCSSFYSCGRCNALREFMSSSDQSATFDKKAFDSHLKEKLAAADLLESVSIEPCGDNEASKVVLTKTLESLLLKKMKQDMADLEERVTEFVRVAVVSAVDTTRDD